MSDLFIVPVTKFVFTNELEQDIFVNINSSFQNGLREHNVILKSKRVTEYNLILRSLNSTHLDSTQLNYHALHICPQIRGRTSPVVQRIYYHDCPVIEEDEKISIRFENLKHEKMTETAFIVVTEDKTYGFWWKSPPSLYNLALWNCVLRGIDSSTIKEYTNQHYETDRILLYKEFDLFN
jgi:hypothetical protein